MSEACGLISGNVDTHASKEGLNFMARPGPQTHAKRQREQAKKEKRRAKEEKKALRKAEKTGELQPESADISPVVEEQ